MRISKVVTKKGDKGTTSLVGGQVVSKSSVRVEAYGDVDELNSILGLTRSMLHDSQIDEILRKIQNTLFILGADLAAPMDKAVPRIEAVHVHRLDEIIEEYNQTLAPLKEFILPCGCDAAAGLHLSRAIARRAERHLVRLFEQEKINETALVYLNRLSDLLFILARVVNTRKGIQEDQAHFTKNP
ncbi:MAG: cob(I)yrinic acid a,c-diamide adenosyltransferase [Acidobacteria bacterium]|nr:cob(I)yrinic acid a,c-diamide adenosyltransferase [Acidobacteriota bacterium]MBI3658291.1 cob(I)yrinic acid a,c-diamide adenosyltransferase [Acidobacteriota bacterium]